MTGMEIVHQELKRMARGMAPLALVVWGILALCGFPLIRITISLLLGVSYSLLLFFMIGKNAVKAVLFPPAQGTKIVRRGYVFRYLLTGVMIIIALKTPYIQPVAAVAPLFFPKIILICSSIKRKGGKR